MNIQITLGAIALGTAAVLVGQMNSDAVAARGNGGGDTHPDVIVGSLHNVNKYGESGGITAYSVGTTSCNQGNDYLEWESNNNQHPTIGQNMYRVITLDNGCTRVEHIGMSWLKHGFCALQGTLCGSCSNPGGGGCADRLGWNCSDPYDAGLNGQQSNLGPRSEVNASNGYFHYPFCPGGGCSYPPTIGRRLQVLTDDMDQDLWPTAEYFVEGMYVHPDDAAACKSYNNASYRPITVSGSGSNGFNISLSSTTRQMKSGIYAWEEVDPNVRVLTYSLSDCSLSGANENFQMAYSTCENDDGTYHYEYALYNLDSDVSFSEFAVPAGNFTNAYSSFAPYHSSSPYTNNEWTAEFDAGTGELAFGTTPYSVNQDANAIRWNTMHTFAFDTTDPPISGQARVVTFKDGSEYTIDIVVPNADSEPTGTCCATSGCHSLTETACAGMGGTWLGEGGSCDDCSTPCNGDVNQDWIVDGTDLALVLGYWGLGGQGDVNGDGATDGTDLAIVLGNWGCTSK